MPVNFTVNTLDLKFILKQINISERHSAGESLTDIIGPDAHLTPFGLRTTDGSFNSLLPGQSEFGAADNIFSRLLPPKFRNDMDNDTFIMGPNNTVSNTDYGTAGNIADADPRIISNLIVDMSISNPAAIEAWRANPLAVAAAEARWEKEHPGVPFPTNYTPDNTDLSFIPNQSPDIGLSPGVNGWFTFFGQFFDHGLDLITKGKNGTIFIPLQPDDPLIAGADGEFGTGDDLAPHLRFMPLTRATPAINPVTGLLTEHTNTTTAFVDQNQTYTSHASHQVFLREYKFSVDSNGDGVLDSHALPTGRLMDGAGGIATWADIKEQAKMLGITLTDFDVTNVPLLSTDAYGKFIPGANGFAQIATAGGFVEGVAGGLAIPANAERTGHAFLDDIAHHAAPGRWDSDGNHVVNDLDEFQVADSDSGVADDHLANTYDDELLNKHFITGDGRGNENIGLTAVHNVFHGEHNRLVDANKATILAEGATDVAFLNEWLRTPVASVPADVSTLEWNGERLFQAAKLVTEMQYQHLVFEEFARKVQPNVDPFVFSNTADLDPQILAEFAHVVYRFGHSLLSPTVARTDANMNSQDIALFDAFLNPDAFTQNGTLTAKEAAGAIARGMGRQVANEIDEYVTGAVRNTLLGLPLDLPAINIARARDTGVTTLNDARKQFYDKTADPQLKPYESWTDYAQNLKNPFSIINFVAAYGTHSTITAATTLQGKRDAATLLVMGDFDLNGNGIIDANEIAPVDRIDFMTDTGTWAAPETGLNNIDFWIGGLAEAKMEFGGMLGSTFNFVFETQLENLQNGDRFYYLSRLQGTNMLNELESNSFAALVMRNTDLGNDHSSHISGNIFDKSDLILELELDKQVGPDPVDNNPILGPKVLRNNPNTPGIDTDYIKFRGGEHVVLGGSEGNDTLIGDKGIDTLWGDGGNDFLNGQSEVDNVFGGDGDDIIIDPFGDDVLRGDEGHDVISAGPGLDLVLGGGGQDFIHAGADTNEVFAGRGDDLAMGGNGEDVLLGNEDNDWLEGGDGFDTLAGENSELFFNSPIIGHDVLFGQGNDSDYDGESGDDIMVSGVGIQRNEGMFGFDWGISKTDPFAVDQDMTIKVFTTVPAEILRDRYDLVEALSGWTHNDILRGDDRGSSIVVAPEQSFNDHVLDQAGINRIDGLQGLLGGTVAAPVTSFRDGNILIGGDGGDVIQGRAGFDIIDGDAWLNVRIAVANHPTITSVENMTELLPRMLSREINPSQLSTVREILYDPTPTNNTDTAVYQGALAEYTIEGRDIEAGGTTRAADLDSDGFIKVTDNNDGPVLRTKLIDDVDKLKNMELLRFTDQTIAIAGSDVLRPTDIQWNGVPPVGSTLPGANAEIANLSTTDLDAQAVSYLLRSQSPTSGFAVSAAGLVTRTAAMAANTTSTLVVRSTDTDNAFREETFTVLTGRGTTAAAPVNDNLNGTATDDIMYGLYGNDTLSSNAGNDTLFGGDGNDRLFDGTGNDNMRGGAGNDLYTMDSHADVVTEAAGEGIDSIATDLEAITLGAGFDNVENLVSSVNSIVSHNWSGNALNNWARGGSAGDEINGLDGNDHLIGMGGEDLLNGDKGNDLLIAGDGNDRINGGEGNDRLLGDLGNDIMRGELGNDRYHVDSIGDVFTEDADQGIDSVVWTTAEAHTLGANMENILSTFGNTVNHNWTGNTSNNWMRGELGNDLLNGLIGRDNLFGGWGDDTLNAGEGKDLISGGGGKDTMSGGVDNDTDAFVFNFVTESGNTSLTRDVITDFISGQDKLYFSGIDAIAGGGNDTFTLISGSFTTAGQLRWFANGDTTIIEGNVNGDLAADFQVQLTGNIALLAQDFVL